jgi:NAD-dependent DNA ligase
MGEKQIIFFIEMKILEYPYDFFEIKNRINKILYNPSWMGQKALSNLLEAVEKSRYNSLEAFYSSLGILHIGKAKAKLLTQHFGNFDDFLNANIEQLEFLGPEICKEVYKFKQQTWVKQTWQYMKIGQTYINDNIISLF